MNCKKLRNVLQKLCRLLAISLLLISVSINNGFVSAKGEQSLTGAIQHLSEGRYPEAITEYYEITEKDPQNLKAYYNLAIIIEIVLEDFESVISLYDKVLSIAENKKLFSLHSQEGMDNENIDDLIAKIKARKGVVIQKIFNSIEGIVFPRYVVLKTGKNTSKSPVSSSSKNPSKSSIKTGRGFRFAGIENNRYQVITPAGERAWVKGDDICLIYQNSNENINIMATTEEKAARYKEFVDKFPDHKLALEAEKRIKESS